MQLEFCNEDDLRAELVPMGDVTLDVIPVAIEDLG